MDVAIVLESVLSAIQQANIPVCVIEEIALNYYNVPRVVHESSHRLSQAKFTLSYSS